MHGIMGQAEQVAVVVSFLFKGDRYTTLHANTVVASLCGHVHQELCSITKQPGVLRKKCINLIKSHYTLSRNR